ncbi:DNA cytosine methyltransferase [Treponema vincentii]|uniref:DNA cytosine methyltransferase n=1 Tax=Treponema vincentii TaxID=69710 RepID=UPI0020A4209F|nr:DNA cytosine methyltransferase [Treponema vincentii]
MGGRTGCLTLSISEYPNGRRRVFVVGHIDNRTDLAAKVLFEPESMCGNIATGSETQKETTAAIGKGVNYFRRGGNYKYHKDKKAATLRSSASSDCFDLVLTNEKETAETLLGWYGKHLWQNNQEAFSGDSFVVNGRQNPVISKNRAVTLDTDGRTNTVCYAENTGTQCHIRCLTPLECERLQGFPDNWTQIEWRGKPAEQCPDSPRYKAIGNSMAVPVMRWIGERIKRIKE